MSGMEMVFRDFVWPRLPEHIRIEDARATARLRLPYMGEAVQDLGGGGRLATGSGILVGAQAGSQWKALCACFAKGGAGTLLLPGATPMTALFTELSLDGAPRTDRIAYSFTFVEQTEEKRLPDSVFAQEGDCLWRIANRWGVPLEALRDANPHLPWSNSIDAGTRVVIP